MRDIAEKQKCLNIKFQLDWFLKIVSYDILTVTNKYKTKTNVLGEQGSTGSQGIQGLKGDQGLSGSNGAKGEPGLDGPFGPQGLKGNQGAM